MTKDQIESIFERVRTWPPERQEDAAQMLLRMEEQGVGIYELSEEEMAELEEAEQSGIATDEEIRALFDRYRAS